MINLRVLYHIIRADFFERTRRYSFLITLGFVIWAAYTFLPPNDASYVTLQMDGHRGVYNSAWVGALVAIMTTTFLSFAGFYLVKNAVQRDRQTGVGEIIAGTPTGRFLYAFGKAGSNFAVLTVMVLVIAVVAAGMQLLRGEDAHIRLWQLWSPFLLITIPVMAAVAGTAVLFEMIPGLRGGLGNAVYYILWIAIISTELFAVADFLGMNTVITQMMAGCHDVFPDYVPDSRHFSMGFNFKESGETWTLSTFAWNGLSWGAGPVFGRLKWLAMGLLIPAVAALFFDRFDTARGIPRAGRRKKPIRGENATAIAAESADVPLPLSAVTHLTLLAGSGSRSRFLGTVSAELRLMLKGLNWWWRLVAVGLIAAGFFAPLHVVRGFLLPFAWVWPLLIWSRMGTLETHHRTEQIVFSAPHPVWGQLPATWLAGVVVTLITGSGAGLHLLIAGQADAFLGWFAGALFIPSMALAMGVWSGSSKLFEVLYMLLWYGGPMNRVWFLDFMGVTDAGVDAGMAGVFSLVAAGLLGLAVIGRAWRVRM